MGLLGLEGDESICYYLLFNLFFLLGLVFKSKCDHVSGKIDTSDFNSVLSSHVESGTADAASHIEDFLTWC